MPPLDNVSHRVTQGHFNCQLQRRIRPVADSIRRANVGLSRQPLPIHPLTLLLLSAINAPVSARRGGRSPAGAANAPRPCPSCLLTSSLTAVSNMQEDLVARTFPSFSAQRMALQAVHDAVRGSTFPLPGASASPRNRQGAAPPKKPAQGKGANAHGRKVGLTRAGAVRRDKKLNLGESPSEQVHGNTASRNPASMAGHAAASSGADAKESLQGPLKHPTGTHTSEFEAKQREEAARSVAADVIRPAVSPPPTRMPPGLARGRSAPVDGGRALPPATAPLPPCAVIDDALVAFLLVRPGRYLPDLMNFCADDPGDVPWLRSLFNAPADSKRGMGGWMASALIEHSLPDGTETLVIRRFGGKEVVISGDTPQAEERGKQRYFSLLTLSLLDAPLRQEAGNRALTFLQPNTFRLLSHPGVDGKPHLYLAYFLHRDASACSGVKAGFVELTSTAGGQFKVDDAVHASSIAGATLGALVASIEKFTGLRYCTTAGSSSDAVTPEPATNLFVDIDQTRSLKDPQRHLEFNDSLDPFSPVSVDVEGRALPLSLYRNSFTWVDDRLFYADEDGETGSLDFFRHRMSGDKHQLRCLADRDCRFARQHGLHAGVFYSAEDVMERLEQGGLVWMPGQQPYRSICSTQTGDRSARPGPPLLTLQPFEFSFRGGVLRYQDSGGPPGVLRFTQTYSHPVPRYTLDAPGDGAERLFSARNGLAIGRSYTESDIVWALTKEGYNEVDVAPSLSPTPSSMQP